MLRESMRFCKRTPFELPNAQGRGSLLFGLEYISNMFMRKVFFCDMPPEPEGTLPEIPQHLGVYLSFKCVGAWMGLRLVRRRNFAQTEALRRVFCVGNDDMPFLNSANQKSSFVSARMAILGVANRLNWNEGSTHELGQERLLEMFRMLSAAPIWCELHRNK